jgi:hypothetical protein
VKWQRVRDALDANRIFVELVLVLATVLLAIEDFHLRATVSALDKLLGR